jgi:hydroxyacylglutathione hydrolase
MRIQTVPCLSDNLSYLVVDDSTRTCVAIDPGEAQPFLETIRDQNLELIAILATHHHYDHIGGLSQMPAVPVWSSQRDLDRIPGAGTSGVRKTFDDPRPLSWRELADRTESPKLDAVQIRLRSMSIPGHTEGQVALLFTDESSLEKVPNVFVGDTLFAFGCGRCQEGTPEILFESLQKLKALPPQSLIYFGHEYTEKNALFWLAHRKTAEVETHPGALHFDADRVTSELEKHMTLTRASRAPKPPPRLIDEIARNPFLQTETSKEFRRWRELRNAF